MVIEELIICGQYTNVIHEKRLHISTYQFDTLFPAKRLCIVSLVPLAEWGSINLNNCALHQSFGSHQFIVTGIVDNINDTSFACLSCNK